MRAIAVARAPCAGSDLDTVQVCKEILAQHHVAVSPGSAFGQVASRHLRVSLASAIEDIEIGMERLCQFIKTMPKSKQN